MEVKGDVKLRVLNAVYLIVLSRSPAKLNVGGLNGRGSVPEYVEISSLNGKAFFSAEDSQKSEENSK
jgi:hypothetical protein